MTTPLLTEIDLFFELILPQLLKNHTEKLQHFSKIVSLELMGEKERSWHISGGVEQGVKRGKATRPADLSIRFSQGLVEGIVQGKEPDLADAFEKGDVAFEGDVTLLKEIGLV